MDSSDHNEDGTDYDIRVTVSYTDHPTVTSYRDFSIRFEDYCNTNVVVTPPVAQVIDQTYTIGDS